MANRPRSASWLEMENLQDRPGQREKNAVVTGAEEIPQHLQRAQADAADGREGAGGGHPQQAAHQGRLVLHGAVACWVLAQAEEIGAKLSLSHSNL